MEEQMKTIAAISTALAVGSVGMIRISGELAIKIADHVFISKNGRKLAEMRGYQAAYGMAFDSGGDKIDDVVALVYRNPKSYTGEDVVELTCHGGVFIMKKLLQAVFSAGAAPAQAGEFTKRAFLNGKIDLAEAEAVMQLISAKGEHALKAAIAGNSGVLSKRIGKVKGEIKKIASHLTAWIDFPEEDVPGIERDELLKQLINIGGLLEELDINYDKGKMMREGIPTVIAGRANAGKSTLMNILSGTQRSIVTEYEGTTRDIVEENVVLGETILTIADTAGIRKTEDPVEKIGVDIAKRKIEEAQLIFAVFDASRELDENDDEFIRSIDKQRAIALINKTDLQICIDQKKIESCFNRTILISAKNEEGMNDLEKAVREVTQTIDFDSSSGILFTERQRREAREAQKSIREAKEILMDGMTYDAITVCVEAALNSLFSLTGDKVSESVIEEVFSTFCVGK